MRLFAALEVPAAVRDPLEGAVAPMRAGRDDLRWTPAHQWHLTIAFLGSVDHAGVPAVREVMSSACGAAPASIGLSLADAGRFGKRVLWIGVDDDPSGAVARLGSAAQEALADADLPVDDKDVHPHLTLARSRGRHGRPIRSELVEAVPRIDASWVVDELVLFASVQQGHGEPNRYEALERLPLGPGPAPHPRS